MEEVKEVKFAFTAQDKKKLLITFAVGVVLLIIGILTVNVGHDAHGEGHIDEDHAALQEASRPVASLGVLQDDGEHEETETGGAYSDSHVEEEGHSHLPYWVQRLYTNLWINNIFFVGLALIGVFFIAIQYASQAGWSSTILRIPQAQAQWLPIAGVLTLLLFFISSHHIFHWTHHDLYEAGGEHFDEIIAGKKGYFFWPATEHPNIPWFFLFRMVAYFVLWIFFFQLLKKNSLEEDVHGGTAYWYKMRKYSAIFLIIFAITSSTAAWDWVMSIDTHWFSTLMGWYTFASWFVAGLAMITLVVTFLKGRGYLPMVTADHLHDLGKYCFAFSIFWSYLWVSQFLLIYYANIPEETVYFVERMFSSTYAPVFYINVIINFVFPFLLLMTRDSKRHMVFLKMVAIIILVGHWIDFYLMITPGTLRLNGGFGFLELGLILMFVSAFLYVLFQSLSKWQLVPKHHPMIVESLHHHI